MDFVSSKVSCELNQIIFIILLCVIYGMVNYLTLKIAEEALYDALRIDSEGFFLKAIAMFTMVLLLYLFVFGLSWLKFKVIQGK